MRNTLGTLRVLALGLWLGAAIFFSAVVASGAFDALRSFHVPNTNDIAGSIVTRALSVINVSGVTISLLLLMLTVIAERKKMKAAFLASTFAVAARMRGLRLSMVAIDQVSPDDPRRIAFNKLHHYSVLLLTLAMCAAIAAILLTWLRPLPGIRKTSP